MFREDAGYSYSGARIYIAQIKNAAEPKNLTYIKGNKVFGDRDTYLECEKLEIGFYYLVIEVEWNESTAVEDRSFVATAYGVSTFEYYNLGQLEDP